MMQQQHVTLYSCVCSSILSSLIGDKVEDESSLIKHISFTSGIMALAQLGKNFTKLEWIELMAVLFRYNLESIHINFKSHILVVQKLVNVCSHHLWNSIAIFIMFYSLQVFCVQLYSVDKSALQLTFSIWIKQILPNTVQSKCLRSCDLQQEGLWFESW